MGDAYYSFAFVRWWPFTSLRLEDKQAHVYSRHRPDIGAKLGFFKKMLILITHSFLHFNPETQQQLVSWHKAHFSLVIFSW